MGNKKSKANEDENKLTEVSARNKINLILK